jgi:hypothetical protein
MEKEVWRDIKGYEGQYQVSNLGKVKSFIKDPINGRLLKSKLNKQGYVCHMFWDAKQFTLHSLVLNAFVPNVNGYKQIDHLNNNKKDNRLENLQWIVAKDNIRKEQADTILCEHQNGQILLAKGTRHAAELSSTWRTSVTRSLKNGLYTIHGWKFTRIKKANV